MSAPTEAAAGRSGGPDRPVLRRLVAGDADDFARHTWGRRPLLTRAADLPGGLADLLTLGDVDELVSRRGVRTPFVRIAREGKVVDAARFTGPGGAGAEVGDQVVDDKVLTQVLDGATIVLQGLHRLWPPVVEFAAGLTTDLGHPVQVNAYVTPPSSRGFDDHYDVHDVFVIQLAGTKRWRIHEPVHPLPLRNQPWTDRRPAVAAAAADPPVIEAVLAPGDVLYLPRGYLHAAEALGGVSAHLTVGVHAITRYALAEALLAAAADEVSLRESLPLGVDLTDPVRLEAEVGVTARVLADRLGRTDPADVAARLRARVWPAARPAPIGPLAQAAAIADLHAGSVVRLRPALRCALSAGTDPVVLELTGRTISLPAATAPALKVLLAGAPVAVGGLPGLDGPDALVLVRRLLREAVVVPGDT